MSYDSAVNMQRPGVLAATQGVWNKFYFNDAVAYANFATGSANLGWFKHVYNPRPFTATHGWVLNGASVPGNIDIGIYSVSRGTTGGITRIGSSGAIAGGTINVVQFLPLSVVVPEGDVVLAISYSSASAQIKTRNQPDWNNYFRQLVGMGRSNAAQHPLPSNVSYSGLINDELLTGGLPLFGVCNRLY